MNERIKQLLAQAHLEVQNHKDTNKIAERFAELIVEDCVNKMQNDYYGDSLDDICAQLKQDFGVE